jgi:hypothetical protein
LLLQAAAATSQLLFALRDALQYEAALRQRALQEQQAGTGATGYQVTSAASACCVLCPEHLSAHHYIQGTDGEYAVCCAHYTLLACPAYAMCSRAVCCLQQPVACSCQLHVWACPDTALPVVSACTALTALLVPQWHQCFKQQQQQPAEGSKEAREARIGLRK